MSGTAKEACTALGLLALTAFAWFQTLGLPSGSAMFPRLALGLLGVCSAIYLARALVRGGGSHSEEPLFTHLPRFLAAVVLVLAYITAFAFVGYFTASLVFVPVFALVMGFRRKLYLAIASLGFVTFTYLLFVVLFKRHLPADLLIGLFG